MILPAMEHQRDPVEVKCKMQHYETTASVRNILSVTI